MIAPTFEPGAQPGEASLVAQQQETTNQSWMDREQQRQRRALEIQHEIEMQPTRRLQAEADRVAYHAKIAAGAIMEETRRQAAAVAPDYLAEFLNITKLPDLDAKAAALDAFAAKAAWLGNIPENKGFLSAVDDARGKAHIDSIAMGKIAQAKDAARTKADTAESQIEGRAKAAELAATTKVEMQGKDLQHKREVDALNEKIKSMEDETKRRGQDTSAKIASDRAAQTASRPATQAAVKSNEAMLKAGQDAQAGIRDAERALALLDEVRTGTGAQAQLSAQRLGQLFGVETSTAKPEELQRILGDAVLKRVNQTKGSISDKEMALFDSYSASMKKSAEGNKAILATYLNAQRRDLEIAKMVNQGRSDGLSEREIQLEVNDFILNNPITAPPQSIGWDEAKEKRLKELKSKLGK